MIGASAINQRRSAKRSLIVLCAILLTFFLSQQAPLTGRVTAGTASTNSGQPKNWTAFSWTRTKIGKSWHTRTNQKYLGAGHGRNNEKDVVAGGLEQHNYRPDGLLQVNLNGPHPIFELMRRAEAEWEDKLRRASKTLEDVVAEYQRRYKRMPPPGFEEWWAYVEDHNVQLPDEYDQIYRDMEPFHGMDPQDLVNIQRNWEAHADSFTVGKDTMDEPIGLKNYSLPGGDISRTGLAKGAYEIMELLEEVEGSIPPFRAVFSPHDNPNLPTDYELREMAIKTAATGKYIDINKPPAVKHSGWISACPPKSPARKQRVNWGGTPPPQLATSKTFIYDHHLSMDPCQHPSHFLLHGQFISHRRGPVPQRTLVPQFSFCVTRVHHDFTSAMPINWLEDIEPREDDPEWDERWDPRLQWRGSNTGIWHAEDTRWDLAQRTRLVRWAGSGYDNEGDVFDDLGENATILMPVEEGQRAGLGAEVRKAFWAPAMVDIAFAGRPLSCLPEMCEKLEKIFEFRRHQNVGQAGRYKYVIDVDGNGWSSRFKRLITSNALVFKSTIYPEWYTDRVASWVHFVPIQVDLSDLWDALTFFRGDPAGRGAHDDLAKKIAQAGREWSKTFWRKEDMVAYMFRLFLEYARVMDPERKPYNPSTSKTNHANWKKRQAEPLAVSIPAEAQSRLEVNFITPVKTSTVVDA